MIGPGRGGLPGWVLGIGLAGAAAAGAAAAGLPGELLGPGGASAVAGPGAFQGIRNTAYDGRFTLARIRFGGDVSRGFSGWGRTPPWAHDFPRAERNLMRIVREVTYVDPAVDGGNVFDLVDPDLLRFPIAYLVEPGHWRPSEEEVGALREYLLKGGFLIVDDFRGNDWINFERQMGRVLPEHRFVEVGVDEPIFHTFFEMEHLNFPHPYSGWVDPTYLVIYEENDPAERVMVMVNYDQDIGDYWEYSDLGRYPVGPTNEAFKLGVNYLIYGMTH